MKLKIKKEKLVMSITIGIACFALMLVMFMQFKVVKQTDLTEIENMRETELRTELSTWREQYNALEERYQEVSSKIEEYKTQSESNEETTKLLETELVQINEALGKTDVQGEGIIIVITDNGGTQLDDDTTVQKITEQDLLLLVNELFAAGAEAISINDNRIVSMSDIFTIGSGENSFLQVNSKRITSPFVIKAIGNQSYLESAVMGNGGKAYELQELGHKVDVQRSREVKINKYDGQISKKYMK